MTGFRTTVALWVGRLWHDEGGNMIENLGWALAVSAGVLVVGAAIYTSVSGMGTKITSKVNAYTGP